MSRCSARRSITYALVLCSCISWSLEARSTSQPAGNSSPRKRSEQQQQDQQEEQQQLVAVAGPDREKDGWTLSHVFKRDLVRVFGNGRGANWTVLEVGSYVGYSTRVLAQLFRRVISLDSSQRMLDENAQRNGDLGNVFFVRFHTALDDWSMLRANAIDVVLLDAEHDYASVRRDVANILQLRTVRFVVFDDTCEDGVRRTIEEAVAAGNLEVSEVMGHIPGWTYKGKVVEHSEGLLCRVLPPRASMARSAPMWQNHRFVWFAAAFAQRFGVMRFLPGGRFRSTWGPGTWAIVDSTSPSQGGSGSRSDHVLVTWLANASRAPPGGRLQVLEFSGYYTAFAAQPQSQVTSARDEKQRFIGVRADYVKDATRLSTLGLDTAVVTKLAQAFQ